MQFTLPPNWVFILHFRHIPAPAFVLLRVHLCLDGALLFGILFVSFGSVVLVSVEPVSDVLLSAVELVAELKLMRLCKQLRLYPVLARPVSLQDLRVVITFLFASELSQVVVLAVVLVPLLVKSVLLLFSSVHFLQRVCVLLCAFSATLFRLLHALPSQALLRGIRLDGNHGDQPLQNHLQV